MKREPKSLQEAIVYFSNPDNCIAYLAARRWPNGVICPICGSEVSATESLTSTLTTCLNCGKTVQFVASGVNTQGATRRIPLNSAEASRSEEAPHPDAHASGRGEMG